MTLPRFEFASPSDLAEACRLLAAGAGGARVLAGGTDLLVKMKRGEASPQLVVSLGRVDGLDRLEPSPDGGLRIGSLVSMSRLARSPLLDGAWAALREGAASVAGPVIRNRATLGGNIVTGRPCADTVPPLIVLGARLRLERGGGSRVVELDGFITGPGETGMAADEILASIALPPPAGGRAGSCYLKITRRAAMEVTIAGCAACVELDAAGAAIAKARVALTSVAPVPLRVREAETPLEGRAPTAEAVRAAAAEARRMARPIDDHRAPASYREAVVEVLTERALRAAIERAGGRIS